MKKWKCSFPKYGFPVVEITAESAEAARKLYCAKFNLNPNAQPKIEEIKPGE